MIHCKDCNILCLNVNIKHIQHDRKYIHLNSQNLDKTMIQLKKWMNEKKEIELNKLTANQLIELKETLDLGFRSNYIHS